MEICGTSNARILMHAFSMIKDTISPQNILYILYTASVEGIFVNKFLKKLKLCSANHF